MEDGGLGDLDRAEPEDAHGLEEDGGAGDDRGRAIRVEADDLAALLEWDGSELAEHAVDGFEQQAVAVDLVRVVGVEVLVDGGERGHGSGDGDAESDVSDDLARHGVLNGRAD